jgi:DNA-binding MarR family transcriptional regulator
MPATHLIPGDYITDSLPILINFGLHEIITIGEAPTSVDYLKFRSIKPFDNNLSPLEQSNKILEQLKELEIDFKNFKIGIFGHNQIEVLSLSLLGISLAVSTYTIYNKNYFELPMIPVDYLTSNEFHVLSYIQLKKKIDSLSMIADILDVGDNKNINKIAKASYFVKKLEEKGMVKTGRDGRNVTVEILPDGIRYFSLFKFVHNNIK